ncbi:MAG: hypothetical protein ACP5N7_06535, partial [Candidatus Pacearchaeota archaeon]
MKIALFDRFLKTMGGGEGHLIAIAEYLAKSHDVDIITNEDVDIELLKSKLHVDLKNIKVINLGHIPDSQVSDYCKKYDLFINGTFFSITRNYASKGAIMIFFPYYKQYRYHPILKKIFYYSLLPFFGSISSSTDQIIGLYSREIVNGKIGNWSSTRIVILTPQPKPYLLNALNLNNISILKISNDHHNIKYKLSRNHLEIDNSEEHNIVIEIKQNNINQGNDTRELGLYITSLFSYSNLIQKYYKLVLYRLASYKYLRRFYAKWLTQKDYFTKTDSNYLDSYNLIITNSEYTRGWTKKFTGKDSEIIYPPIDIDKFSPTKKKKIIISVGRFFISG